MAVNKKQILLNAAAFLLLFMVSLYRQASLRFWPEDPFRTYILFACYVFLLGSWAVAIHTRVTQKSMRTFLVLEAAVMLAGLATRFLQDTFWYENILLTRVSGLCLEATILPVLVFGIFASLGIGRWDHFRIPKSWYLLMVPAVGMAYLCVTDESRHFMFYIVQEEPQPNLDFHPYIGSFLLLAFSVAMMVVRVVLIYQRNRMIIEKRFLQWFIPLFEPLLALFSCFEYFVVSLRLLPGLAGFEVIELFAKIYYIEALTWEFYIYMGLVPVNTKYPVIFGHATVDMQIIADDGYRLSSGTARELTPEQLQELKEKGCVHSEPGKELHMYRFADGLFLWNKDVSLLQHTIDGLNQSAEALAQEGILLDEEIKTKNLEASLLAKNQIYDDLAGEVKGQLRLMKEIIKKRRMDENSDELLRILFLLGIYVKRRCNLRLIQKEADAIHDDDLRLSFQDMVSAMKLVGIRSELRWYPDGQFSAGFSIYAFDLLEDLLEYERFAAGGISISAAGGQVCFAVAGPSMDFPDAFVRPVDVRGYSLSRRDVPGGYEILLAEGGE